MNVVAVEVTGREAESKVGSRVSELHTSATCPMLA